MKGLLVSFLILLFGCTEVYFTDPQPVGKNTLPEIPPDMQGRFVESNNNDTIFVRTRGFDMGDDFANLSDSLVIKKWKGYYFLNIRDSQNGLWEVYAIQKSKDGNITVFAIDGEDEVNMDKLSGICTVITNYKTNGEVDSYLVNPSLKEFKAMLKANIFNETIQYSRIY